MKLLAMRGSTVAWDFASFWMDWMNTYQKAAMLYIHQLIKKKVLPKAIVIVASRPAAASKYRYIASRQVEVIGFLKPQISDYIDSYPFSKPK